MCYFSSAMEDIINRGVLRGRPFGGVATFVRNDLLLHSKLVAKSNRFIAVSIGKAVFINIYGSSANKKEDKLSVNSDLLAQLEEALSQFSDSNNCVVGGDFNIDIRKDGDVSQMFKTFFESHDLVPSINVVPYTTVYTYWHTSLGACSTIDYFALPERLCSFVQSNEVLELEPNFSDHFPVMLTFNQQFAKEFVGTNTVIEMVDCNSCAHAEPVVKHLRWDHADVMTYYFNTMKALTPIYDRLLPIYNTVSVSSFDCYKPLSEQQLFEFKNEISKAYNDIVIGLTNSAAECIPLVTKNFFKYWWNQELNTLKENSIAAHKAWTEAGSPRSGDLFEEKKFAKSKYKNKVRQQKSADVDEFNNCLHDALLSKDPDNFWKSWRSKFGKNRHLPNIIDGSNNRNEIADKFGAFFADICNGNSAEKAANFEGIYKNMLKSYNGDILTKFHLCTVEQIDDIIHSLKFGKAAGLDGITAEHIIYSHPVVVSLLVKLFNLMIMLNYIPVEFGFGLSIPLPKENFSSILSEYRCTTVSPVISKIFELCISSVLKKYLYSSNWQLGFKKKLGCNHAIYAVRKTVDYFVKNDSTVNICALDISKAFDKINQHCLLLQLSERRLPVNFLLLFELWFTNIFIKVKWCDSVSRFYRLSP